MLTNFRDFERLHSPLLRLLLDSVNIHISLSFINKCYQKNHKNLKLSLQIQRYNVYRQSSCFLLGSQNSIDIFPVVGNLDSSSLKSLINRTRILNVLLKFIKILLSAVGLNFRPKFYILNVILFSSFNKMKLVIATFHSSKCNLTDFKLPISSKNSHGREFACGKTCQQSLKWTLNLICFVILQRSDLQAMLCALSFDGEWLDLSRKKSWSFPDKHRFFLLQIIQKYSKIRFILIYIGKLQCFDYLSIPFIQNQIINSLYGIFQQMSKPALEFYQTLKIAKTASQQQIKQSYKKLALKYHPDKNQDKETAKIKFRQISEAYSVLNNPEKRQIYDKYGMVDDQLNNFTQFQQFMGDFGFFQDFLQDFLMFDSMSELEKMLNQVGGKNKKSKKKGGKRKKTTNSSTIPGMKKSQIQELQKLFGMMGSKDSFVDPEDLENLDDPQILQAMMAQMMMQQMMGGMQGNNMMQEMMQQMLGGKKTKKNKKQSSYKNDLDGQQFEDLQSDDGQLTQLQLKTLQFGQMNVQKKKVKKKNVYYCKFDSLKLKKEQILMHFTEKHLSQVNKWIQKGCGKQQQKSQGFVKVSME